MALFTVNKPLTSGETNLTANILDLNAAPHAFKFKSTRQTLTIENNEAVPITVNLLGDGQTSIQCPGYGAISVSAGKDFVVAAGDTVVVNTNEISGYLGANGNNVVVAVTGSTGASLSFAWLSEW